MSSSRCRPVTPLLAAALLLVAGVAGDPAGPAPAGAQAGARTDLVTTLDHLLSFIEWPEAAFPEPGAPLVLGIVGQPPFPPEAIARRSVGGRPIRVERLEESPAPGACHVLWVGSGAAGAEPAADAGGILTVSDREGFVGAGGMVELRPGAAPVLDLAALGRSGLGAHPHLLTVSQVTR